MDLSIDACIENDDTLCDELKEAISQYREGIDIVRIKGEFSKEELKAKKQKYESEMAIYSILEPVWDAGRSNYTSVEMDEFQMHMDGFFRLWVTNYGNDGCTNYIHNIAAGHILYFMMEYGYLSKKYSQQSHEAANAMMTSFFFCRSQLGGFTSVGQENSKLRPLARWFQRRLIWMCGLGTKVFDKKCDEKEIYEFISQGENESDGADEESTCGNSRDAEYS
jgi:hypothetical protein